MITGAHAITQNRLHTSSVRERFEATIAHREVSIGYGSKSLHFRMRSSRFHRSVAPSHNAQGSALWRAMSYIGCASLVLGSVFVAGSVLRASPPIPSYAVVMPIEAKPLTARQKAKPRRLVRAQPAAKPIPMAALAEDRSLSPVSDVDDLGTSIGRPAPDVAALPTINGERAVAVYGPLHDVGGRSCRDVSVFVRDVDGKVSVSPTTECKAAR